MGFDAHTHLDAPRFDGDRDAVIARARAAGIQRWVVAGTDPEHWGRVLAFVARYGGVAALGVHPWWVAGRGDTPLEDMAALAARRPAAIGETGLDWFRERSAEGRLRQERWLRAHLDLARAEDVPVVLHCVRAMPRLLDVLEEGPPLRGMVHGWTAPASHVGRAVDRGLHLSFGTRLAGARHAREACAATPATRLLLETDCPDQPLPGLSRGEPAHLRQVAALAAEARGESADAVLAQAAANAAALFGEGA